jgi:hypothetical protein
MNNRYIESAGLYEHALEGIAEVWDKYKLVDRILTDTEWTEPGRSPHGQCLYDLWQAIRTAMAIVEGREL